jgi:oligopeptidase B
MTLLATIQMESLKFSETKRGLEYSILILKIILHLTNKDKAINFKLMKTPESKTSKDALAHRKMFY